MKLIDNDSQMLKDDLKIEKTNTKRFTANYVFADSNFEISNISHGKKRDKYHSIYCLLHNLLQRGCPTQPSVFLHSYIQKSFVERKLHLFSKEIPDWGSVIKGYDPTNSYPARVFYYSVVPKMLSEYPFLQQILIPEMPISEFIFDENKKFKDQTVDFFISEVKLVIEIDGSQHSEKNQKELDKKRDKYIRDNGYSVIRIPSKCINDSVRIEKYIRELKYILEQKKDLFSEYKQDYYSCVNGEIPEETLKAIALMRFQITVLQLCINGILSLDDKEWKIAIKNKEVTGYEMLAIEDVFLWFKNICTLAGLEYKCKCQYKNDQKVENKNVHFPKAIPQPVLP